MAERLTPLTSRIDALKRQLYDALTNPKDYLSMVGGRAAESLYATQQLQKQAFGDPRNPFKVTNENALRQLTDALMSGPLGFAPAGITAYHGSPYLFKQFDPMKVGTGEGAQAYGVGAGYTAEARPVAEAYRNQLSNFKQPFIQFNGKKIAGQNLSDVDLEVFKFLERGKRDAGQFTHNTVYYAKKQAEASGNESVLKRLNELGRDVKFGYETNKGYLYKGDIPDEIIPLFLDWDKPLTKDAPQEVKDAFNKIVKEYPEVKDAFFNAYRENKPGWYYHAVLMDLAKTGDLRKNQEFATKVLQDSGIRGIRYLDQGSRGEGKGTSNFIPFRPEDFKIQEINDRPLEEYIAQGLLAP